MNLGGGGAKLQAELRLVGCIYRLCILSTSVAKHKYPANRMIKSVLFFRKGGKLPFFFCAYIHGPRAYAKN